MDRPERPVLRQVLKGGYEIACDRGLASDCVRETVPMAYLVAYLWKVEQSDVNQGSCGERGMRKLFCLAGLLQFSDSAENLFIWYISPHYYNIHLFSKKQEF